MRAKAGIGGSDRALAACLRIVLPYMVLGAAWILFSDRILTLFEGNPDLLLKISTAKGWLYILVTSLFLYLLVSREFRRRAELERKLEAENEAKAVLLAEVHHRVKNNLQIISSILGLEEAEAASEEARKLCVTTASRVRAMAIVHETLYSEGDFASLDLAEYLRELCSSIGEIYLRGGVLFGFDLERIDAVPDVAIPFGLLVSEAVTNAVRHGLPAGFHDSPGSPSITVSLRRIGEERVLFRVRDCGPGFDEEGPVTGGIREGLGISLMRTLAAQLGGKLRFGRDSGGVVELDFSPRPRRPAREDSREGSGP